jgi:hypothetical protein
MVAKGKYKKGRNFTLLSIIFRPFTWLWNPLMALVE